MVQDPTMQGQSSPIGTLLNYILIVLFFFIDGPTLIIEGVLDSYTIVPPDQLFSQDVFKAKSFIAQQLISVVNTTVKIAVKLAAPSLIVILMTDTFLGIANRMAPQVQITFLGLPLKSLLGLLLVFFAWKAILLGMISESFSWINVIKAILQQFDLSKGPVTAVM